MKLFRRYDSPSTLSRALMAAGDLVSFLVAPLRPSPRLPLAAEFTGRLLLLRLDGIGDNVCTWAALELLRRELPRARIALAVGPWAAPLYRECPWVDQVIVWDSGLFGLFRGKGPGGLAVDLRISSRLRGQGFDAGIDLRGDLLSIFLLRLVATPVRVAQLGRGGKRLLSDPLPPGNGHEAQRCYDTARLALGLPATSVPRVRDWLRPQALEQARFRLREAGWAGSRPTVALCPLALWHWKGWPAERFQALANRLKKELGLQVLWFLERPEQAARYAGADPFFCGELDQVAAALGLCRLAVASDSGLLHLAVAAGCATVQLFGPGDAARFAHTVPGTALHRDEGCPHYPCTQRGDCANRPAGWCLEKIGVDEVFASCSRLLRESGG